MIGKTISHYRITEKLGEGGMGVVYEAVDTKLDRTIALKFLPPESTRDPDAKARFIHEAKAASALDHPNVCNIHEIDSTDDGQLFIVMARYEGETLKDRIAQGPLPIDEAVDITRQVAEGLAKAHEREIVHRDIKPANIFLTNDGLVKILDFGLAKLVKGTKVTKTGTTLGTAGYMSPEQARGEAADHRTDLWCLGVVLYEMVTGRLPFLGDHEQAIIYAILSQDPDPVTGLRTGVPMELERIIGKCLAKDPAERYQHAEELLADLLHFRRETSQATTVSMTTGRPAGSGARRWPWLMGAVVMAALALAIYPRLVDKRDPPPDSGRKMLVVLPIENLGHPDDEYFADGLTEEITSRLATLPDLGVISRTSAVHYSNTDKTIRQIGEELGVDYVLEGTVRWDHPAVGPSRVRITSQLIRASDDTHHWANSYDCELTDIFEVQADIARQVVEQLDIAVLEGQSRAIDATRATKSVDAYQAYLRGLHYRQYMSFSEQAQRQATAMFERAVELDPRFALAYAELSIVRSWRGYIPRKGSPDFLSNAKAAADSALKIRPDLPEAHLALGYYWGNRDYDAALREFGIARRGLPNDFRVWKLLGFTQHRRGDLEGGLESYGEAFALSPQDAEMAFHLAAILTDLRRYEEAIAYCDRALSLAPDFTSMFEYKAQLYWLWKGETQVARTVLEQMPETNEPDWTFYVWYRQKLYERDYPGALDQVVSLSTETFEEGISLFAKAQLAGLVYYLMGEADQARESFDSARILLETEAERRPGDGRIHRSLGVVYAGLGRKDDAVREGRLGAELRLVDWKVRQENTAAWNLAVIFVMIRDHDAALEQIEHLLSVPAHFSVGLLRLDPMWDPLRDHPRYQALLEEYGRSGS
jgi:serine/threonine protein kinase/Flp pilus assembly protein TadD